MLPVVDCSFCSSLGALCCICSKECPKWFHTHLHTTYTTNKVSDLWSSHQGWKHPVFSLTEARFAHVGQIGHAASMGPI